MASRGGIALFADGQSQHALSIACSTYQGHPGLPLGCGIVEVNVGTSLFVYGQTIHIPAIQGDQQPPGLAISPGEQAHLVAFEGKGQAGPRALTDQVRLPTARDSMTACQPESATTAGLVSS